MSATIWKTVESQAELDAAIAAGDLHIEIAKEITVEVRAPDLVTVAIKAVSGAVARVLSGSVEARNSSRVEAWGSSRVVAWGSSRVEARDSSRVVAWGSSSVEAWGSSRVEARDSSRVVAWGSSSVEARDSSRVVAWGSSRVEARDSSSVEALDSSRVEAWMAASLSIFNLNVSAKATAKVSVHLHNGSKCEGGVQILIEEPSTPEEWCEWHGATVISGHALLFKAVDDDFKSPHGANYQPGTQTIADDWDGGEKECGGGLHFCATPAESKLFNPAATKFVACMVPLSEIAVHKDADSPNKVKAKSCWNYHECDEHGAVIGEKFAPENINETGA